MLKVMKQKIYNLIVLDESGSMDCIRTQTINGCNETINTIKAAQNKFEATQEHFVSIYVFQKNTNKPSRYLIKNMPAGKVHHIGPNDYEPYGGTPLNDAVGSTLIDLFTTIKNEQSATGSVTIITDGEENASEKYTTNQVANMIEQYKELGWNFNFIGANINVEQVAMSLNIENHIVFEQTIEGTAAMFEKERKSRMNYLGRIHEARMAAPAMTPEEERAMNRKMSQGYFEEHPKRFTPEKITRLEANEVFVFGSNLAGQHGGGAARIAYDRFGAQWGEGVGHFGQTYAIPTMQGGVETIKPFVDEFIAYAKQHPELTFLVTRIGCGVAGFKDRDIAPLFVRAQDLPNVVLPKSFVDTYVA